MKTLDGELSAMIGDGGIKVPGLGVIVYKNGKQVYSFFGGRRHIAPDKPVDKDTLFRAASLSKMFTVFTIMQLVEQGKIDLTDDVSKYLDFALRNPNFSDMPITVEMLASHTSSLHDGNLYIIPPQYSLKEFFTVGGVAYENGAHFATQEPGKFFSYCNLNYGVLGTIIERVTGERFDRYQQEHILKQLSIGGGYVPANFSDATFNNLGTLYAKNDDFGTWIAQDDDYTFQPRRDTVNLPTLEDSKIFSCYDVSGYKIGTNATIFEPQGGLRISFTELGNCLEMLMNRGNFNGKQILRAQSVDTMLATHWLFNKKNPNGDTYGGVMENYGLATYKLGGKSKARPCRDFAIDLVGHSGEARGMISGLYFIPDTRDGFIFMINGRAITLEDKRSLGKYSANFIWEEGIMDSVCRYIFCNKGA